MLAFVASLAFMALEMVAGRLVQRHLGSSIYGWTSVIGVLLAGLSFGNFLGGKIADFVKNEKQASWLFLAASILTLTILLSKPSPNGSRECSWAARGQVVPEPGDHAVEARASGRSLDSDELAVPDPVRRHARLLSARPVAGDGQPRGGQAGGRPAEKLQADRNSDRPGLCLGHGRQHPRHLSDRLFLDRQFGTKGVILLIGTIMAFGATMLGSVWHAVWAGIPLGLCVLAFTPPAFVDAIGKVIPVCQGRVAFEEIGKRWGIREQLGRPRCQQERLRLGR